MQKIITMFLVTSSYVCSMAANADSKVDVIKSNSVTWMAELGNNRLSPSTHNRQKRAALVDGQKEEIVNIHNQLRALEQASDMEMLTWNDYLASMASDWAERCQWTHGQPARDPATRPYNPVGQNLYAVSGTELNVTRATIDWYSEKEYYSYDTMYCTPGQMCGHYTQVVWSATRQVGCAYTLCPTLQYSSLTSAYYLVCNYGPAGNFVGVKPFKKGESCSNCSSGIGWCTNRLCNGNCKSQRHPECQCGAICYNCATLNRDTCSCRCADGFYGDDCSAICQDQNAFCNANPGWPPHWCNDPQNGDYVRAGCPAMCGLCKKVDGVTAGQCKPIGGLGVGTNSAYCSCAIDWLLNVLVVLLGPLIVFVL